jgi:hypothetical protein
MTQGAPVLAGTFNTASQTTDITLTGPDIGLRVESATPVGSINHAWAGIAVSSADPASTAMYAIGRGRGVYAVGLDSAGVFGFSYHAAGVVGRASAPTVAGVFGTNSAMGIGVQGSSEGGIGVLGRANGTVSAGVQGDHTADGPGVLGTSARGIGVVGRVSGGIQPAILGDNESGDPDGVAVAALGGAGVGVHASGARAAIILQPVVGAIGPPTTGQHSVGEMLVDNNGDLWLCKVTGLPGKWVKVA